MLSAICLNLDQSKILSSGSWLMSMNMKTLKNIVEKRVNACKKKITPFPTIFSYLGKEL